jgi:hypothetical protein
MALASTLPMEAAKVATMHRAKRTLLRLAWRSVVGEPALIGSHGHAEAKPTGADIACAMQRRLGLLKGKLTVPDDLDSPLPDHVLADFEGGN